MVNCIHLCSFDSTSWGLLRHLLNQRIIIIMEDSFTCDHLALPSLQPVTGELQIDLPLSIQVPYQWFRVVVEKSEVRKVYYVTPSGHVLLSDQDAQLYLELPYTCKCYLDLSLEYQQVFNFDPDVTTIQSLEWHGQIIPITTCDAWASGFEAMAELNFRRMLAADYMMDHEVSDIMAIYQTLSSEDVPFKQWLDSFEWDKIQLLEDGHLMSLTLSQEQLKHFAYELHISGKFDFLNDKKEHSIGDLVEPFSMLDIANTSDESSDEMDSPLYVILQYSDKSAEPISAQFVSSDVDRNTSINRISPKVVPPISLEHKYELNKLVQPDTRDYDTPLFESSQPQHTPEISERSFKPENEPVHTFSQEPSSKKSRGCTKKKERKNVPQPRERTQRKRGNRNQLPDFAYY